MTDPVKVASDAISATSDFEQAPTSRDCDDLAESALHALRDDGWRIVRTDPVTEPDERPIILEEWTNG